MHSTLSKIASITTSLSCIKFPSRAPAWVYTLGNVHNRSDAQPADIKPEIKKLEYTTNKNDLEKTQQYVLNKINTLVVETVKEHLKNKTSDHRDRDKEVMNKNKAAEVTDVDEHVNSLVFFEATAKLIIAHIKNKERGVSTISIPENCRKECASVLLQGKHVDIPKNIDGAFNYLQASLPDYNKKIQTCTMLAAALINERLTNTLSFFSKLNRSSVKIKTAPPKADHLLQDAARLMLIYVIIHAAIVEDSKSAYNENYFLHYPDNSTFSWSKEVMMDKLRKSFKNPFRWSGKIDRKYATTFIPNK